MDEKLIYVVDDDRLILDTLISFLGKTGFRAKGLPDGTGFFKALEKEKPALIILDLNLPDMDGFEICKNLKNRERYSDIPVIILSGKGEEGDKVSGLDLGADDYVVKPFSLEEMKSRINAVLRRAGRKGGKERKVKVGGSLVLDLLRYEVLVNGKKVDLTPTEFKILEFLSARKGQVFSRDRILDYLWGEEKVVIERTIDVHIRHLREKLGKAGDFIKNVRGVGYKVDEEK